MTEPEPKPQPEAQATPQPIPTATIKRRRVSSTWLVPLIALGVVG